MYMQKPLNKNEPLNLHISYPKKACNSTSLPKKEFHAEIELFTRISERSLCPSCLFVMYNAIRNETQIVHYTDCTWVYLALIVLYIC